MYKDLTDEQLKALKDETDKLLQLSDTRLIFRALSELVGYSDIPIGIRVSLMAALDIRARGKGK